MARVLHILPAAASSETLQQLSLLLCNAKTRSGGDDHVVLSMERATLRRQMLTEKLTPDVWCGASSRFDLTIVPRLMGVFRRYSPDILHCWQDSAWSMVLTANRLTLNRPVLANGFDAGRRWATERFLNLHRIVHFDAVKQRLLNNGWPSDRVSQIPVGIEVGTEMPHSANGQRSLRTQLGLPGNALIWGAIGDLSSTSHFEIAMWALDLLGVIRPEVHLVIFGRGSQLPKLRQFQDKLQRAEAIHFVDSWDDAMLAECEGVWNHGETSLPMLRAMAAELPVVAAECDASRAVLEDATTGFIVPRHDPAEFARKANLLLKDAAMAERIGKAARRRVEDCFPASAMIAGYATVYRQVHRQLPLVA